MVPATLVRSVGEAPGLLGLSSFLADPSHPQGSLPIFLSLYPVLGAGTDFLFFVPRTSFLQHPKLIVLFYNCVTNIKSLLLKNQ